jgi:hypothetical protein
MWSVVIIMGVTGQGLDNRSSTSGRGVIFLFIIASKAALWTTQTPTTYRRILFVVSIHELIPDMSQVNLNIPAPKIGAIQMNSNTQNGDFLENDCDFIKPH